MINEAYDYLKDPALRRSSKRAPRTGRERDEQMRQKRQERWEQQQRSTSRQEAQRNAQSSADEFVNSRFYKATKVIDTVYNYVFMAMGLVMVFAPITKALTLTEEEKLEYNYFRLVLPVLIGLTFIYGVWYFIFKLDGADEVEEAED